MYIIYVNNTLPLALAVHEISRHFWAAYTRRNEQLDQRCQQLVAILFSKTYYNVVLHPINSCCQQALFTVVGTTIVHR